MDTYYLANPLSKHPDVGILQVALKKAEFYFGPLDSIFGAGTAHACQTAKYRFGYPTKEVTLSGGQRLLNFLRGTTGLPLSYQTRRRLRGFGLSSADRTRNQIVTYALWGCSNEPDIHYNQTRLMDHLYKQQSIPWNADCSEFVTTIYKWAGGPDPNDMNFNGEGYTGTMLSNGVYIPLFQAKKADVVIWGGFPGHHTAVLIEDGRTNNSDPMLVSHGREAGPHKIRLSAANRSQNRSWYVKRYIKD